MVCRLLLCTGSVAFLNLLSESGFYATAALVFAKRVPAGTSKVVRER